jgi:hypothetical protein
MISHTKKAGRSAERQPFLCALCPAYVPVIPPESPHRSAGPKASEILVVHMTTQLLTVSPDTVYDFFKSDTVSGNGIRSQTRSRRGSLETKGKKVGQNKTHLHPRSDFPVTHWLVPPSGSTDGDGPSHP